MRNTPKVVAVMAVLCAIAYALHRLQAPLPPPAVGAGAVVAPRLVIASADPAAGTSTPDGKQVADSSLVYPDALARTTLHLGYEVFTRNGDGSMMALPLPPDTAWQTTVALKTAGHRRLVLAPMQAECAFAVTVEASRVDRAAPIWHGALPAHSAPARQVLDLAQIGGGDVLLVSFRMAEGAQNNWSCNVAMTWDDAPDA